MEVFASVHDFQSWPNGDLLFLDPEGDFSRQRICYFEFLIHARLRGGTELPAEGLDSTSVPPVKPARPLLKEGLIGTTEVVP